MWVVYALLAALAGAVLVTLTKVGLKNIDPANAKQIGDEWQYCPGTNGGTRRPQKYQEKKCDSLRHERRQFRCGIGFQSCQCRGDRIEVLSHKYSGCSGRSRVKPADLRL